MYESIQGILKNKEPLKAIIEASGIGYRISIPLNTFSRLGDVGKETFLYLTQVVREDAHTLYGFIQKEERDLFETLITLSGIGPKTAVTILGNLDLDSFHNAILSADTRLLSKIPGIGKKTAERLVIEMKDKSGVLHKKNTPDALFADAVQALMHLGYALVPAQKAVNQARSASENLSIGELITAALKHV